MADIKIINHKYNKYMDWEGRKDYVYIGRGYGNYGRFGNPYSHLFFSTAKFRVASVQEAINKYREYFLASPALMAELPFLATKKYFGCWCHHGSCHGNIIIDLVDLYLAKNMAK